MNFDYSEDDLVIKEQARRFLAETAPRSVLRDMLDGRNTNAAAKIWRGTIDLGWPGIVIPERYGGLGMGYVALCALAEEIGRAAAPLPMLPSVYLAAEALLLAGSEAQKQTWLPALAAGDTLGTAFLTGDVALRSGIEHRDGKLHGTAIPVPAGLAADFAIIASRGQSDGLRLFLIDLNGAGVSREAVRTIDDSLPHAALTFENAAAEPLGAAEDSEIMVKRLLARAAVLVAFEQLGGADACLEMARTYALQRRSFNRLVASYQVIKHKLADMYIMNELARSNAYYSAWALAENAPELECAAAAARLSAIEAFEFAASENIEIHGGMGFTWESDCHLFYRRSRMLAHALGPAAVWQDRLVAALDNGNMI